MTLERAQSRIWCSKIGWQTVPCSWSIDGEAALTNSSPGMRDSVALLRYLWYGDISIFKMAAVRHLGIVLPSYETTHEIPVAGRSCLSNFMSIWHTDLNIYLFEFFAYLAWNAYKMGVLGDRPWTPKCDYSSSRLPKGTSLCKSASFKLSTVKIRWAVWPVGELTESVTFTHTDTHK